MKLLIRLFPRAWRQRYGAEFEALLETEKVGVLGALDIVGRALALHARGLLADVFLARSNASSTYHDLRPVTRFGFAIALMSAVTGGIESRNGFVGLALLACTTAAIALNLLSGTAQPRDARRARFALTLILFCALSRQLWTLGGAAHPSLLGPLLAISTTNGPWPRRDRLPVLLAGACASGLNAAALPIAAAFGGVSWTRGLLLSGFWTSITLIFLLQRARLAKGTEEPAATA